jgi:hypothetical protein
MWRLLLPMAFALVLLTPDAARAADSDYVYAHTIGGTQSCGTWTAERRAGRGWFSDSLWVLGFLSGVAYQGARDQREDVDPLRGVDAAGVEAWLDNYCQAHPLKHLTEAADAFVDAHPH